MFHKIKRYYQRLLIASRKKMSKEDRILKSKFELDAIKLVRKLTHSQDVELFTCPETGRRFIDSERLDIKIILELDKIIISNHSYLEFGICPHSYDKMKRIFDGQIKIRRDDFQRKVTKAIDFKLQNLIKQIN